MATVTINQSDETLVEALWTMLRPLKRNVRQLLASRLEESIATDKASAIETTDMEKAMAFIQTLSVSGTEKVPDDANGIEALVSEKYSL